MWPRRTLEGDSSLEVHEVKSIGPSRVGSFRRVVLVIHQGRELDPEIGDTVPGDRHPLLQRPRSTKQDLLIAILGNLPGVDGMRLLNVDHEERDPLPIGSVESVQSGNLPPERGSSVAAEDEYDRFRAAEGRECRHRSALERAQSELGGVVTLLQVSAPRP